MDQPVSRHDSLIRESEGETKAREGASVSEAEVLYRYPQASAPVCSAVE